jgi:hypothetical protein
VPRGDLAMVSVYVRAGQIWWKGREVIVALEKSSRKTSNFASDASARAVPSFRSPSQVRYLIRRVVLLHPLKALLTLEPPL